MASCTFFGHHDCPEEVRPALRAALIELIEKQDVFRFYVGNHGAFDAMARSLLAELSVLYPHIDAVVVLAYRPTEKDAAEKLPTLYPDGIDATPKRFAISFRNNWMLRQADHVITYINHGWGGAAQFAQKALRQGKTVIPLGSYEPL